MKIKYNRVSTLQQSGLRFTEDKEKYDLVLLDKTSGSLALKDRPKGKVLFDLIENGKVTELVIEEFSRIGRNTGDVINNLIWLEAKKVNVIVRNIGLQSRPNGNKNPIWDLISTVMTGLYAMELENIKERTKMGRLVYVQNGGTLGRPSGTNESDLNFLKKEKSQQIIKGLKKGLTIREISAVTGASTRTIQKVKSLH
jgi:DNA invertase Pin-like site-specific DNA recombinase